MATRSILPSRHIVTFQCGSTEYSIDHCSQQLTTEQLGCMFNVQPSTLWLSTDNRAFFAIADGSLNLPQTGPDSIEPYTTLVVQGSPMETQQPPSAPPVTISAITPAAPSSSNRPQWSGFNSVVNQSRTRTPPPPPSGPGYPLKVVQAKIVRFDGSKPNFERIGQTFVNITESTANLNHVLTAVQEEFGEEYVVTTANRLEVKDSSGTQGEYIHDAWHA